MLAAVVVGCVAVVGLAVGAVHGVRGTAALSSEQQVTQWQADAAYWDCLDTQAHSLFRTGERVWLDTTSVVTTVALGKVLGPWAVIEATRRRAQAYVALVPHHGPGACLGSVVVGRFPGRRGAGTVVRVGSGASVAGTVAKLPSTPL